MDKKAIYDLKWNYNNNLLRYYKGCKYCEEHRNEIGKWMPELSNILNNINILLEELLKYENISKEEILEGFKL